MQIDIKTSSVEQLRHTFSHVARFLGGDKPASRYQEATIGLQPEVNFHYRPLWQPDYLGGADRVAELGVDQPEIVVSRQVARPAPERLKELIDSEAGFSLPKVSRPEIVPGGGETGAQLQGLLVVLESEA